MPHFSRKAKIFSNLLYGNYICVFYSVKIEMLCSTKIVFYAFIYQTRHTSVLKSLSSTDTFRVSTKII